MINTIESSIIAYFDNRLSDAERVDLLRQVNESEDARKLFRQHEVLRSLVQRAQARTVVDAETESLLLSKISPVARTPIFRAFPIAKTFAGAFAVSALIFLGYFASSIINGKGNSANQPIASQSFQSATDRSIVPDLTDNKNIAINTIATKSKDRQRFVPQAEGESAPISSSEQIPSNATEEPIQATKFPEQAAVSFYASRYSSNGINPLSSIAEASSSSANNIRLSLQAESSPINDRHFGGVSGGTATFGYFISPSDILSAQMGYRASRLMPPTGSNPAQLTTSGHDDHFIGITSGGLEFEHQVMAYDGRLIFSGSLGAGLQTYGNYESLNLSASTPLGGNLLTGIGASVSHEHFTTSTWPVSDPSSPSGFSPWTNLEAKNFITAKIYFMVSYGF